MSKITYILICCAVFKLQYLGSSIPNKESIQEVDNPIENIITRLVWIESSNRHSAYSKKGAIGRYQITPPCLEHFNTFNRHGLKFTIADLWKPSVNRLVGRWYFNLLLRYYSNDHFGRIVKVVNGYNMGFGNNHKGRYNYSYLSKIVPNEWETFRLFSKFVKYEPKSTIVKLIPPSKKQFKLFIAYP